MLSDDSETIISVSKVSKKYRTFDKPVKRLFELLLPGDRDLSIQNYALKDVSFKLGRGGKLGIVGANGSGKSTLLKIITGVLNPTEGEVIVNGRVAALLELGAGFSVDLSGRENAEQFCRLQGFDASSTALKVEEIRKFSELDDHFEHSVRTYSSGMAMRLGFACAIQVEPDILIIDEALSVGDAYFANKCLNTIKKLINSGVTFIYVSHAMDSVQTLCEESIWLESGKVKMFGPSKEVVDAYQSYMFGRFSKVVTPDEAEDEASYVEVQLETDDDILRRRESFRNRVAVNRVGSGEVRVIDICTKDELGQVRDSIDFDKKCVIELALSVNQPADTPLALCIGITNRNGLEIVHFNSLTKGIDISNFEVGSEQTLTIEFEGQLCPGEYGLVAGVGVVSPHPVSHGLYTVDDVIDHCVGGWRFVIEFPKEKSTKDLWGYFDVDYKVVLSS